MPEQLRYFYTDDTKAQRVGAKDENGVKKILEKFPNAIEYDAQGNIIDNRTNASPLTQPAQQPAIPPLLARPATVGANDYSPSLQSPLPSIQPEDNNEYLYPKTGEDAQKDLLFEQIRDTFNTGRKTVEKEADDMSARRGLMPSAPGTQAETIWTTANDRAKITDPQKLITAAIEKNIPGIQKRVFAQLPYTEEYKGVMAAYKYQLDDIYTKLQSEENTGGKINLATSVKQLKEQTNNRINQIALDQINKAVNDIQNRLIKEEYVDKDKINNSAEYIIREGIRNSIFGKLKEWADFAGTSGMQRQIYDQIAAECDPSWLTQGAAGAVGLIADAPLFALGGGVGAAAGRPLVNAATKHIAKRIATLGGEKIVPEVATQMAAKKFLPQIIGATSRTSGALATYDATQDVLNQQKAIQLGQQDTYNPLQTLAAAGKGAATGAIVGPLGAGTGKIMSMTTSKLAKGAIWTGGFAAENTAFVTSGAALDGRPITAKDFLDSFTVLGIMKGFHISTATIKERMTPRERFGGTNYNTERAFNIQRNENFFTKEERADLERYGVDKTDFVEGIAQLAQTRFTDGEGAIVKIMNDPEVAASTKMKLTYALTGKQINRLPYITSVKMTEMDGKYLVETSDSDGTLIERKAFNNKANAKDFHDKMLGLVKDQWIMGMEQMASETTIKEAFEKTKETTGLSDKQLEKIFKKDPAKRTAQEKEIVDKYSETLTDKLQNEQHPQLSQETQASQQPLTEPQANQLISAMEQGAVEAPVLELTPENWYAEFGEDGKVQTPLGEVKMGENQLAKLILKKRTAEFGMIKPTLTDPDVVIEKYDPQEGAERDTKLLFIKTFTDAAGNKYIHFESVTVQKDGLEVSISSHIAEKEAIAKELINGTIAYNKFANKSEGYLPENPEGLPDLVPTQANSFKDGRLQYQRPDMVPGADVSGPTSTGQPAEAEITAGTSTGKGTNISEINKKTIAQKIISGGGEWSPEELQYYQNNPQEIENEVIAISSHTSGAVIIAADAEGNQYYVKDGDPNNPDGTIIVTDAQTGESKQLSPKGMQFQEASAEQYRQQLVETYDRASQSSQEAQPSQAGQPITLDGKEYTIQGKDENGNIVLTFENEQGVPERATMPEAEFNAAVAAQQGQPDPQSAQMSQQPLTEPQAAQLISAMEQGAEPMQRLELTPENWKTEFGENGILETPIGQVKMGGNQYEKIIEEGREEEWGMIKPTLTNPDVIVEEPSKAKEGQATERPSSYVFIKTFNRDGKKIKFFTTITINREGFEIAISSHYKELSKIRRALTAGRLQYTQDALRASVSDPTLLRQPAEAVANAGTSTSKSTNISGNNQENEIEKITAEAPKQKNGNVDFNALMDENPAAFAVLWENRSSADDAKKQLQRVAKNIDDDIQKKQKSLEGLTDFNKIADTEAAIRQLQEKQQQVDEVIATRYPEPQAEAQPSPVSQTSKSELDENGISFVSINGGIDLGTIKAETGLTEAPIRLSEGVEYSDGQGYGLAHIEKEHGAQIRSAGYNSIEEFVAEVASNYTTIRKGNERGENETYLLEVTDKHNNTLFVELSNDGNYWNVNSAGIFRDGYSAKKNIIWTLPTVSNSTNADAIGVNHGTSNGATVASGNSPQITSKDNANNSNSNTNPVKILSEKEFLDRQISEYLAKNQISMEEFEDSEAYEEVYNSAINAYPSYIESLAKSGELQRMYDSANLGEEIKIRSAIEATGHKLSELINTEAKKEATKKDRKNKKATERKVKNKAIEDALEIKLQAAPETQPVSQQPPTFQQTVDEVAGNVRLQAVVSADANVPNDTQSLNNLTSSGITEANAQEMQRIKAETQKNGTFMKAPNGKPTKLNERQWLQVRTKAFKKFFGDWENDPENASKIVDENGEPMRVYHGTREKGFTEFIDAYGYNIGFFFSSSADISSTYQGDADVMEVFLNIRDPKNIDAKGKYFNEIGKEEEWSVYDEDDFLLETFDSEEGAIKYIEDNNLNVVPILEREYKGDTTDDLVLEAKGRGIYDGVVFEDLIDAAGEGAEYAGTSTVVVAFSPSQIKSATENNGNFDEASNDIRYQFIGEHGAENLEAKQNENAREFVKNLFNNIISNPSDNSAKRGISVATLSKDAISAMESISDIKIKEDTKLAVSSSFLKHIYNNHYGENEKDPGNNAPLTDADIDDIVDIMTSPDMIVYSGKDRETAAHVFSLLKENANGTYSLIDLYANSDGKLKPKTLYNSRKSISGQVMMLSQPSTSGTRTRSIVAPKSFATLSNRFSDTNIVQNFQNPKLSGENSHISDKKFTPLSRPQAEALAGLLKKSGLAKDVVFGQEALQQVIEQSGNSQGLSVNIINTAFAPFKNNAEAKQWAIKNGIVGKFNSNAIGEYVITTSALDKYLHSSSVEKSDSREVHYSVLRILPEVINNSILGETHLDYYKKDGERKPENGINPNVIIHRLYGAINIDGKNYRVKTTLKEHKDINEPTKPYTYEVTKIELLDGKLAHAENSTNPSINNSISVAKLLNGIEKSYEKGKFILDDYSLLATSQGLNVLKSSAGEVYGAVKDGVVYIDDTKLNANTPIHEFGHLWNDFVKKNNPELWAKIVELTKETHYYKDILSNPAYSNLKDDDARTDEAFAQAMGDEGERIFNDPNMPKSIKERFKQLFKDFWEWLGKKLGIRNLSPEQISQLTFEQAVKGAVADITSGKPKSTYDFDVSGITEANAQEMQRIKAETQKNGTFMKSPNGKPTKLNERQWLQVRTKAFKKFFGDWELANKLRMIEDLAATNILPHNLTIEQLLEAYKKIGEAQNKNDNRNVTFVNTTFEKILRHKGIDTKKIIPQLKEVFENSVPIYSESETTRAGHREHNNFVGYNNYLGRVNIDGKEYYVRFTTQELKPSVKKGEIIGKSQLHSTAISDVAIYEKSDLSVTTEDYSIGNDNNAAFSDTKLQQFFEKAREVQNNSSKVVDENGEPLAMHHTTKEKFTEFDKNKVVMGNGGFFFTTDKDSRFYGNNIVSAFLNIKNPANKWSKVTRFGIDDEGLEYDGSLEERGNRQNELWATVFEPSQIKSATDNNGNFDETSNDIRFQISRKQKRQYTAGELQLTPDQLASPEPPTTPAKKIQGKGTKLIESLVDKHQRLYNTIKEIEKRTGKKIAVADNPYERLTKLSARAQAAIEDFNNKTFQPLLNRIAGMNEKIPEVWDSATIQKHEAIAKTSPFVQLFMSETETRRIFDFYMIAKHAPHRNAYIEKKTNGEVQNGSGITADEAAAVVDIFEQQFTAKEVSDFWKAVEKATDTSLNAWRDTGRITPETYNELKKELPYFVPLRNWDDSETDRAIDAVYAGRNTDGTYSSYKQAEGRKSIADSPLSYISSLAQSAIAFKEKNDVKQMLFDLAAKAKQPDLFTAKKIYTIETLDAAGNVVATRETVTDPRKDPAHPLAPNERVVTKSAAAKSAISPYLAKQHEIETWINGQKYILEFADEQTALEINESTNAVAQALQKTIGRVTKGMSGLMTQKNPVFWTKNTLRDIQQAAIRLGVMYDAKMARKFIQSLPRATQVAFMAQFANKETGAQSSDPVIQKYIDYYEEYRKSGSRVGFMQMLDIDRIKKDIDKSLKHVGEINNGNFLKKGLRAINGLAAVSEDISRFAAFIAARETGRNVSEASSIAKEVTVNFNRSGKYSGIPGAFYAFFNATVQATANQVEMFKTHPVKASIAAAIHAAVGYGMYILVSALLSSDDGDDDKLRNLSNYRKYINLFFPVGGDGFAQFPLSQTWRPFYALGVAAAQVQKDELSGKEAFWGVLEQFGTVSPIELAAVFKNPEQLAPTALVPLIETFITHRNYMGAPLVAHEYNDPDGKVVPYHERGVRTDQIPLWQNMVDLLVYGDKSTGKQNYNNYETGIPEELHGLDISPDQLQHLVISYTGGLGSAVNDIVNLTYSILTGGKKSPNKIPIVSSYYSEAKPGYYTNKYYHLRIIFDQFEKNLEYDEKTGRVIGYGSAPEFDKLLGISDDMSSAQIQTDMARGKALKKIYDIWDALDKKMQRFSAADMVGTKDKDEIRKEVERISKETVKAVEPVFKELGIKY